MGDALLHALPSPFEVPEHDSVREDLLALLTCFRSVIEVTKGSVIQVLKTEESKGILHATIRERITTPLEDLIHQALLRGTERGEVRPAAASVHVAQGGPGHAHLVLPHRQH